MYSIRDDIKKVLTDNKERFSVHLGTVSTTFDVTPEVELNYPRVIITELSPIADGYVVEKGETRTSVTYQIDIITKDSILADTGDVVNRGEAAYRLAKEINDFLDERFKLVRRFTSELPYQPDAVRYVLRMQCIIDEYGYTYRPTTF